MIRVYFLRKPRLSFYAICGDIVRSSSDSRRSDTGDGKKVLEGKNSAGWGRGESYLSSPSLQSIVSSLSDFSLHSTIYIS